MEQSKIIDTLETYQLCADKDGEANMCYGKWIGDDDYNTPLDLQDTYQQRRVISMPTNLLGWSQY